MYYISDLLKIPNTSENYGELSTYEYNLSTEIISWLLKKPDVKNFKISGFIDLENKKECDSLQLPNEGQSVYAGILISFGDYKLILTQWIKNTDIYGMYR